MCAATCAHELRRNAAVHKPQSILSLGRPRVRDYGPPPLSADLFELLPNENVDHFEGRAGAF
jgi:hypothetical protein